MKVDWKALRWWKTPLYVLALPFWVLAMVLYEVLEAGCELTDWLTSSDAKSRQDMIHWEQNGPTNFTTIFKEPFGDAPVPVTEGEPQ